jgi:DNA gyrase subunit B
VEGESAGGSAKQARDRGPQAILPLKGKILNVEKARFDKMLSSVEVATLITALGCGIGREEYNPDKLRYHRIIIMTDADVDGSHIRTLLLTFFFRQMPELIERGYIYIAQPPLYKIKKGKQEQYIKDNDALDLYLIHSALEEASLYASSGSAPISGTDLENLVLQYQSVHAIIQRFSRRYPRAILEALMSAPFLDENQLAHREKVAELTKAIEKQLALTTDLQTRYTLDVVENSDKHFWLPQITMLHHGLACKTLINKELFSSPEYRKMTDLGEKLRNLLKEDAYVQKGDKQQHIASFKDAIEWLIAEAKKGQAIQRYKGLGEMNPEQLWDTTMNPETRRLLQVTIEDAVAADQIFTTLMGDQVEPRREFIELNALDVVNLDI